MAANPEVLAYVIAAAKQRGIDPDVAVKAFMHEGLGVFDPTKPDLGGDENSSFGPFQLHYGGRSKSMPNAGMADDFTAATGLRADDPSTWRKQTDFVMDYLAKGGSWKPWMGAAAEGITGRTGLPGGGPYSGAAGTARVSGPVEAAGGGFGNEAAKAAPQLTNPAVGEVLAAAVKPEDDDILGGLGSSTDFSALAAGLKGAGGTERGGMEGQLNTDLPTLAYGDATPGAFTMARGAGVGALPALDLGSLFQVGDIGGAPAARKRTYG